VPHLAVVILCHRDRIIIGAHTPFIVWKNSTDINESSELGVHPF